MATKGKTRKKAQTTVKMRTPEGYKIDVPLHKVRVKQSWGWRIIK